MSADNSHLILITELSVRGLNNLGLSKYDQEVYEHFMDVCDSLPLASVINNKFFAVHGGISP